MRYLKLVFAWLTAAFLFCCDVIGAAFWAACKAIPGEVSIARASFADAWAAFKKAAPKEAA